MGNREVNYPDILPQEQPLNMCLCHAIYVSNLTLTSTTTPQGMTLINEVIRASSAHLTNMFEIVNHPVINILMRANFENVIIGLFSDCRKETLAKFSAMV